MGKTGTDCKTFGFSRRKYGNELLIDLIRLESLEKYNRKTPRHFLSFYDITLIQEGAGKFALDDIDFPVEPNQLYFTAPAQVREWKVAESPRGLVLIFEEEFLCSFFSDPLFVKNLSFFRNKLAPPQLKLSDEQGRYLTNLLLQIEREIESSKETHLLRALLYQALAWLNNVYRLAYRLTEKPQNPRVVRFFQLVENHYCTEHVTSFYAEELCITPGYLNELVKSETGVSAKQYIINRLITEARRMLQFSETPVAEIAWKLGFEDSSYFVRLFRNEIGVSPLAFRKSKMP
jgi:AraC-like DNA-binding protein